LGFGVGVCGLWFVVCGLWFVVCGLWFVVCGLWFVVCGLWFVVCDLWFVVCGLWFVVCGSYFVVCGSFFVVRSLWLVVLSSRFGAWKSGLHQDPRLTRTRHPKTERVSRLEVRRERDDLWFRGADFVFRLSGFESTGKGRMP